MCKLSLNIVPNVYKSLHSSFLSLAWPCPGRSLPKGNQWEWWDPEQEPLPGLGEVGHSPRGTSGSAGTLYWGPMWLGSQSTCHCQCTLTPPTPPTAPLSPQCPWNPLGAPSVPYTSYTPCGSLVPTFPASLNTPWHPIPSDGPLIPPMPPDTLHPLEAPMSPYATYTPSGPWVPTLPASPNAPLTPLHPWQAPNSSLIAPNTPTPLGAPNVPLYQLYPLWPLSTYTPCQPPMHPWHTYTPWKAPNSFLIAPNTPTPPRSPNALIPPIPLLAPEYLHSMPAPNAPLTPLTPWQLPNSP